MMNKSAPVPIAVSHEDGPHLNPDFECYDSEEDVSEDSDLEDVSSFENDVESDVTLEELAGVSFDFSKSKEVEDELRSSNKNDPGPSNALVPVGDPYDVDSEEEQSLLRGIKDEVNTMVREEMQSELELYEHKMKAIEEGRLPSADENADQNAHKYPDLADMTPELRGAYIKMRKLDRILEKKVQKEREVKRERILLERRMREEIMQMQAHGQVHREIQNNTDKYLALTLPASHNQDGEYFVQDDKVGEEGVIVDERPVSPVFQTQVTEEDLQERAHNHPIHSDNASQCSEQVSGRNGKSVGSSSSTLQSHCSTKYGRHKKRRKDFIKRNKELAANAHDMVAMTDDEKKRLQELLADVDAFPEIPEESMDANVVESIHQVAIRPGEGFVPTDSELRSLTAIDQQLQSIMPEEEFRSIASSALSYTSEHRLFTRVAVKPEVDSESYMEKALMETKEQREITIKLKEIDDRLAVFQNAEDSKPETPLLTAQQLNNLLDDCIRCFSHTSLSTDTSNSQDSARTMESARAELMANPPRLEEGVLQKLLSEAHFPLSSHLLSLQDDDSKSGEDGEAIRAETWKVIASEKLSGGKDGESRTSPVTSSNLSSTPRDNMPSSSWNTMSSASGHTISSTPRDNMPSSSWNTLFSASGHTISSTPRNNMPSSSWNTTSSVSGHPISSTLKDTMSYSLTDTMSSTSWNCVSSASKDTMSFTPRDQESSSRSLHVNPRQPNGFPHPSASDNSIQPAFTNRSLLYCGSTQALDLNGRESRISLPEISSSPLINTTQGSPVVLSTDSHQHYFESSSSWDNMEHKDVMVDSMNSGRSADSQRMASTPNMTEERSDSTQTTPSPYPPPLADKSSSKPSTKSTNINI